MKTQVNSVESHTKGVEMKQKDIPAHIALMVLEFLPKEKQTIDNIEAIFDEALHILKTIPLDTPK